MESSARFVPVLLLRHDGMATVDAILFAQAVAVVLFKNAR